MTRNTAPADAVRRLCLKCRDLRSIRSCLGSSLFLWCGRWRRFRALHWGVEVRVIGVSLDFSRRPGPRRTRVSGIDAGIRDYGVAEQAGAAFPAAPTASWIEQGGPQRFDPIDNATKGQKMPSDSQLRRRAKAQGLTLSKIAERSRWYDRLPASAPVASCQLSLTPRSG